MTIVQKKYRVLAPRAEYLNDIVVLAQAWKKSHSYVRRHNWYADALELDFSAVDLDTCLLGWARELDSGKYKTKPLMVVPAPKNAAWTFSTAVPGGWAPLADPGERFLRPLAHIGVREQTVATAVMLCLAECIESAQGDPTSSSSEAAVAGVYSYGNRLYCNWDKSSGFARFPWGNSNTYSSYFQDYQAFVARPSERAIQVQMERQSSAKLYIVKLDLSAFYDNIYIPSLIGRLKRHYATFRIRDTSRPRAGNAFWVLAERALTFGWRRQDHDLAGLFKGSELPRGLPQGLVASGFFANAYLIDFDADIGKKSKGNEISKSGVKFRLHDYCRYVDDLRLVVSVDQLDVSEDRVASAVAAWVQTKLDKHTASDAEGHAALKVNAHKTEIELHSDAGGESGTAARMRSLQQQLSGPFDIATLHQVETGLNGLLAAAELELNERNERPVLDVDGTLPSLAAVARSTLEVRDDTLTRFSAYRLTKSLRMRRSMTDLSAPEEDGIAKDLLLREYEAAARRLVAAWAVNPSLVQVLRYALDLFPSPELLETITDALIRKLESAASSDYELYVVYYVLSELFRAGASETGRRTVNDPELNIGDIATYRKNLATLAKRLLKIPSSPWYLQQQAAVLVASVGEALPDLPIRPELRFHQVLHEYFGAKSRTSKLTASEIVAVSLVGHQIRGDTIHYVRWFRRFARKRAPGSIRKALELIGHNEPSLLSAITRRASGKATANNALAPRYLDEYIGARTLGIAGPLPSNEWVSFAQVLAHPSAPFGQENSLLQLGVLLTGLLVKGEHDAESLTPLTVELRCASWGRLTDPRTICLETRVRGRNGRAKDPRYATPPWCTRESAWMYAIGRLLRAAATSEPDFTTRQWALRNETEWYHGLHSTWQKRRMGLLNTSTALRGSYAAITPWFSQLLSQLLLWPGVWADDILSLDLDGISTPGKLLSLLKLRLLFQANIYGASSDMPLYVYPVEWKLRESRQLRVVILQGLMPLKSDFDGGLSGLNAPGFRAKHRNHTAAMLHLAHRQIQARDSVLEVRHKPFVDLVVLPEYSIHVDDQDLMRAFSDATGAMLFYGLLGARKPGSAEAINAARWLIPQRRGGKRSWIEVDQGKYHLTEGEKGLKVASWRPHQVVIELKCENELGYRISGAVCYDATDVALAADLRDHSHMFVIPAMNQDVKTFDSMVGALRYHMYQHVVIANSGEFGGSTAQAPYDQEHKRLIAHVHGTHQLAVSIFDVNVDHFGPRLEAAAPAKSVMKEVRQRIGKTPPAGLKRKPA